MGFWDQITGSEQDRRKLLRYLRAVGWWAAAAVGVLLLAVVAVAVLAPGQWRAYTDGIEVYPRSGKTVLRNVVGQAPKRLSGSVKLDVDNYEPTMTGDGRMMIFARWRASKNADLFVAHWDGKEWSKPKPLSELNTPVAELGPDISRDGKYLYFYSNRPGGKGGYDIWLSRWTGQRWSEPVNLGEEVNSEFNEYGPCLSPDGGMLLFSSNRPKRELTEEERNRWRATLREVDLSTDYDIYMADVFFDVADLKKPAAKRTEGRPVTAPAPSPVAPAPAPTTPPQPQFTKARSLDVLNSPGFDGQIALTPRADFVYFSSNRRGGEGGFDIYRSRLYHGEFMPPRNIGPPVNTESNEMDSTLSVYGYWLVFSSNRDLKNPRQYQLYETVTREVMAVNDLAGLYALLSLLDSIKWWLLLLVVTAVAVAYMLYLILGDAGRRQSLLAKCMLGSALTHVLLLMLLSLWMITVEVGRAAGEQMMIISIDADTLASEKLALKIREEISDLEVAEDVMAVGEQALLPVQEIEPMTTPPAPSLDAAFQVKPTDLEVRPRPLQRPTQDLSQTPDVREIQPLKLAAADIKLETRPLQPPQAEPKPDAKVTDPFRAARLKQPAPEVTPTPAALRPAAKAVPVVKQAADFKAPEASQKAEPVAPARADVPLVKLQEFKLATAEVTFETPRRPVEASEDASALRPAVPARTSQPADTSAMVAAKPVAHEPNAAQAAKPQPKSAVDKFGAVSAKVGDTKPPEDSVAPGEIHKPVAPVRLAADVKLEPAPTGRKDTDVTVQRLTDDPSVAAMARLGERKSAPQKVAQTPVEGPLPELDAQIAATPGRIRLAPRSPEVGHLTGPGVAVVRKTPMFKIDDTGQLESRKVAISPHLLRDPELRKGVLKGLGGSKETEADVARALKWFTKTQEADGRWACQKHGGQAKHDIVATAFATLRYYGWGAKHTEKGPHQKPLAKGVKWLVSQMKPNGDLTGGVQNGMYDHGVATMALAEGYALTKDPALKEAVRKATDFIVKAQSKQHGGWRYRPNSKDGDTSVFGWQVMALMSAQMAGFKVPDESFRLASHWLDRVGGGTHGGQYGYTNKQPKPAMVAEGMFCQQLMGVPPEHKRMQESAAYLKTALPSGGKKNFYYWYYGCLSLYQHQGPVWEEWNERMKQVLRSSQIRTGKNDGSWDPNGQWGKGKSGRVVTTGMATLSLEVYYRFLPMYRSMRPATPKDGKKP